MNPLETQSINMVRLGRCEVAADNFYINTVRGNWTRAGVLLKSFGFPLGSRTFNTNVYVSVRQVHTHAITHAQMYTPTSISYPVKV